MSSRTFLESKEIFKVGDKITWGKYILEDGKPFDCQKDWPDVPETPYDVINFKQVSHGRVSSSMARSGVARHGEVWW